MGTASAFLQEYATNLRSIDWYGKEGETGFPDFGKCVKVRRLQSRNLSTAALVSILKACGSTLEEIWTVLRPVVDSDEVVSAIEIHCKKLSVIDIMNSEEVISVVGQERYSSLICGYGTQVKRAMTHGLDPKHLVEVVKACTNLEIKER